MLSVFTYNEKVLKISNVCGINKFLCTKNANIIWHGITAMVTAVRNDASSVEIDGGVWASFTKNR